jgi:hypothetical protein
VADSDVEGEFDEMLLKAHRLITTICDAAVRRNFPHYYLPPTYQSIAPRAEQWCGIWPLETDLERQGHRKDGLAIAGVPPEKLLSPPPAPAPEPPFSGAAAFLRSLSPRGMDLGVGRIRSFLASLGEPQNQGARARSLSLSLTHTTLTHTLLLPIRTPCWAINH